MKRGLIIAVLPLALGGCLPLPITIASTAFSGISYLTSGKSASDHVLSATMKQDCALTRPVIGESFCRDVGPDGEGSTPAVTVAHYPGDRDDGLSNDERLAVRTRGALNMADSGAEPHQVAIAPQFLAPPPRVSVAGIIVTKDQVLPGPQTRALPIAADTAWSTLVPTRTIEVAPLAAPIRSVTTPAQPPAPFGATAPGVAAPQGMAPKVQTPRFEPPKAVASAPAARPAASKAPALDLKALPVDPAADRWVIVGSFRDVERAKVMARRFAEREPTILAATVEGGQWHRVAIGPLTPQVARGVRDGLGRVDGRQPWVIRTVAR